MGLRQLLEDRLKIRFRPSPTMMDEIPVTSEDEDLANSVAGGEQGSLIDVAELQKFRSLSRYRNERFAAYEDMMSDPIIAAALEMYADDATQYNDEGQVIWVESDNPDIAKAGTRLLDVLGFNKNSWRYIYALCTYGEIYLELFNDGDTPNTVRNTDTDMVKINPEEKVRKLQEYIEYVNDPSTVFELQTRGKTSGYIRVPEEQLNTKNDMYKGMYLSTIPKSSMELHNRLKFIHISLSESVNRHPECLGVENDDGTTTYYNIKTGKSILDDAYSVTQDTKLLEDSLLLNRLTRSALVRLLEIEVGNMPKPEVEALLRRVKNMLEQKMSMNKSTGEARSYNAPGPMENIIYFPVHEGKGHINIANLGGDVNVKDIVDMDYFNNKKLAALKIPKQFLNFDSPEGLGNGTKLTKVSSRYAHTIMRIQTAYCEGISTLLNLFFLSKGLQSYVNDFQVKMVSPATVEDMEREERKNARIQQAADLYDFFEACTDETRKKVLVELLNNTVEEPTLAELLEKDNSEDVPDDVDTQGGMRNNDVPLDLDGDDLPDINMDGTDEFVDFEDEQETTEMDNDTGVEEPSDITPEQ